MKTNPNFDYINLNNLFISNPKNIKYLKNLIEDTYFDCSFDNVFTTFWSIDNIIYLIYSYKNNIISYNLIKNQKINEIKEAHKSNITNFKYFLDKYNKRDLIISVSFDNNIKLWNIKAFEIIIDLKNINLAGVIFSSCFLNNNNEIYIVTCNYNFIGYCEPIKIFNFKGNKIKEINDSNERTFFIDSYYDNKLSKNFIITGNYGFVKSYDYRENKIYYKYSDNDNRYHISIIIINNEELIKLIESSEDGNIRIWNFHTSDLLNKIKIGNYCLNGICLWNKEYLFIGCSDKSIKLLELKKGIIFKDLVGHNNEVITIKKINHPIFGECLISQGIDYDKIKIWTTNS